jgi:hypothetical protein
MRSMKSLILVGICIVALGVLLAAKPNDFGVANTQIVSFDQPIYVGSVLLPKGDYQVTHAMEGTDHIMVFSQLHTPKPVEARVKCTLVPLPDKAKATEKIYMHNAANERVLQELVFRGDSAKHVF